MRELDFNSTTDSASNSVTESESKFTVNDPDKIQRVRESARVQLRIENGCSFVLSDQHYYPGLISKAHKASLFLAEHLKPFALINNGDSLDFSTISRWPVGSFRELSERPSVAEELAETKLRLSEYEQFDFVKYRTWNLGNHDARFETRLADQAKEYKDVWGFTLKDHFPGWIPAWRTDFMDAENRSEVLTQHRFKGGMHAGQNNALWAATNVVTGHDHMLKAYTISNASRLIWGIHAGTMAPIDSPHFVNYTEDRVVNWQQGFAILHFDEGQFIGPELVHVTIDGRVLFRGKVYRF